MRLSPVSKIVLVELLIYGDNSPGNISEGRDVHHKSVSRTLKELQQDSVVRNKGNGVYTLTDRGEREARKYIEQLVRADLDS